VLEVVAARADDTYRKRVIDRIAGWNGAARPRTSGAQPPLRTRGRPGAISAPYLFATLNRALSQDDIVGQRGDPQCAAGAGAYPPHAAGKLCRSSPAAGLGFSGGMALGLKLAQPERRIVQIIGDGGFHFSSPDSVFAVAQQYQIPILTVVLDNGGWQAVKSSVQRVYPKGVAAETNSFQSQLRSGRQGEQRNFSDIGRAFGAHA
jgi:acetolactate synthase-1/2/3 large subunit